MFNQTIGEFFNDLMEMFPDETCIKINYTLFQSLCKTNAKKPCSDFILNSLPHLEQIALRDDTLFTSNNKLPFLSKINFEKLWLLLSDNNKTIIWKYIQSFFAIGINIIEVPPESLPLIDYIIKFNN